MIEVTVNAESVAKLMAALEKNIELGTRKAISETGQLIQEEILTAIKDVNAIASTDLMKSVTASTLQNRMSTGTFASGFSTSVGSTLPYASDIEEGMPAGRNVSTEEILNWMILKGMEPSLLSASRIARKLRAKGYEGRHVFAKGLAKAEPRIQGIAEKNIQESLNKV